MPTVPYNPVPQVDSTSTAGRVPDVAVQGVSAAAFGGDIAQGLEGLGKTLGDVGDEWYKRGMALQKLNNESEAREAEAAYTIAAGDLSAKYNALQGKDAIIGRQPYVDSLRALREEHMAGLSNPESKRAFSESSLGTMSRLTLYSATHAATENRKYVSGAAAAQYEGAVNGVAQTPEDPSAIKHAREVAVKTAGVNAAVESLGPEAYNVDLTKRQSLISKTQINAVADQDPFRAQEIFDANRSHMTAADIASVETVLKSRQTQVGSRNIETAVNADLRGQPDPKLPEKSIGERTEEARRMAERQRPGDPEYADQAVARVTAGYSRRKAEIREANLSNSYTVNSAVIGDQNILPTNLDELRGISPAVSKAYDDLPPERKKAVLKGMALNAKGDVPETAETIRTFRSIQGKLTSDDPDDREEALYTDAMSLPIPLRQRSTILAAQEELKHAGVPDARVTGAMRMLQTAGIAPTNEKDGKDNVEAYRGGLQEAINAWQAQPKNKGQRPSQEDLRLMGSQLRQEAVDPNRWSWGIGANKVPVYKFTLPPAVKEKMLKEAERAGRPEPTDEEMRLALVRLRYRETLEAKPK